MDDWQLLQSYVEWDSETAFRTLINRYVNLVYSVALRQVQDPHLTDEVAQAVFILLARKARGFRQGVVLSGWLFRTTRFVASRAIRTEQRRQRREQEAFAMQQLTTTDDSWKRISPALDDALEQLGETDRNAVLLRFFNGKSHRETAAALGISEDAAKKRVTRALDKLRNFFADRGVTLSAAMLASAVAANAAKAATPEVIASVTAKVAASSSVAAGVLPPLVSQTLSAWRWAKLKLTATGIALVTAAVLLVMSVAPKGPSQPVTSASAGPVSAPASTASQLSEAGIVIANPPPASSRAMRFRVVAADSDEPVSNARMAVRTVINGNWEERFDDFTDEAGRCGVPLPTGLSRLDIGIIAFGWGGRFMTWVTDRDGEFPAEYTLRVQRVTNSMGGWVRDETGRPVAGAEIWMQWGGAGDASARETPRERPGFFNDSPVAVSDQAGYWSCAVIPGNNRAYYSLNARHPDFAQTDVASANPDQDENAPRASVRELWAGTRVTILTRGITVEGRVSDQYGQPIAGANIVHAPFTTTARSFATDADGRFAIKNLPAETFSIAVQASGFAPEYRQVNVQTGMAPLEIPLQPGRKLRLRIVDDQGLEVPGATVALEQWGEIRQELEWRAQSGRDGRMVWDSAPPASLELCAFKEGWCYTRGIWLTPDEEEHTIVLRQAFTLFGFVADAETGAPVTNFNTFPGYGGTDANDWERLETRRSENGTFTVTFSENKLPWRVRVEAEGYEPVISDPVSPESPGPVTMSLRRVNPAQAIRGFVVLPDGTPATNAQVALLTLEHNVSLGRAKFRDYGGSLLTNADARGFFEFAADPRAHSVAAVGPAGFAKQRLSNPRKPVTLQLQAWGRIEGVGADSARLSPTDSVTIMDDLAMNYQGAVRPDINFWSATPDASGRFVLEQVPPGEFSLYLNRGTGIPFSYRTEVNVRSGKTTVVQMGGKGRTVVGQFAAEAGRIRDWVKQTTYATLSSGFNVPAGLTGDAAALWAVDFWQSQDGIYNYRENRSYSILVTADGSFRAEGVEPGGYDLNAAIADAFIKTKVQIPEVEADVSEVDLGMINLPGKSQPQRAVESSGQ